MIFDPVAYAMGAAGASRDLISALMGAANSGGGVTLETSGWVKSITGTPTVKGNVIDIPAGNVDSEILLANPNGAFKSGDTLTIAVTVEKMLKRLNVYMPYAKNATWSCVNGLYTQVQYASIYTTTVGSDIISYSFSGNIDHMTIYPATVSGGSSQNAYATLEITGLKFNDEIIFGEIPSA